MIKKFISSHHYKIILGAPIVFLVLVSTGGALGGGNLFLFSTKNTQNFPLVGDEITVMLDIQTKTPINALGGNVHFDSKILQISSLSRINSIIDLWSEEPSYSNSDGTLRFSGGVIGAKAEEPINGNILEINFHVISEGKATITMTDGEQLLNDGQGTNMTSGSNAVTIYARKMEKASPDINGDGNLTLADANILYLKTFSAYDVRYDLNNDGVVSWADVKHLVSLF